MVRTALAGADGSRAHTAAGARGGTRVGACRAGELVGSRAAPGAGVGSRAGEVIGGRAGEAIEGRAGEVVGGRAGEVVGGRAGRVVVGVDGTCSGRAALRLAAARAGLLGTGLLAVHVPPPMPVLWGLSPLCLPQVHQWRQDLEEAAFLDTAEVGSLAGVDWAFRVERGAIVEALSRRARHEHAPALVVAAGARHRHRHRCPARRLSTGTDLPVLVAAPDAEVSPLRA